MVNDMYGYILKNWHIPEKIFACSLTENHYWWHPLPGADDKLEISLITGNNITFSCSGEKYPTEGTLKITLEITDNCSIGGQNGITA